MAHRRNYIDSIGTAAAVVSTVLATTAGPVFADAAAESTTCRHPAPIYREVPRFGAALGDVSENPISYCQPTDDRVRVTSPRPRFDNLDEAWLPVTVTGAHTGRRTGWMVRRHLDVPVSRNDDASYVPVRPADG